jgi:hypothetical protein
MVPTRTDTADARTTKLANIDSIVRAKLGIPDDPTAGGNGAAGATGPAGGRPPLSSFQGK